MNIIVDVYGYVRAMLDPIFKYHNIAIITIYYILGSLNCIIYNAERESSIDVLFAGESGDTWQFFLETGSHGHFLKRAAFWGQTPTNPKYWECQKQIFLTILSRQFTSINRALINSVENVCAKNALC